MKLLKAMIAALALAACQPTMAGPDKAADRIFVHATFWMGDGSVREPGEGIAVKDGRIIRIADPDTMGDIIGPDTETVDLGGGFLTPGFIDTHIHALFGGPALAQVQLRDANTKEEFIRRIGERAKEKPGEWILEGHWDEQLWGGELPSRDWIDSVTGDTPVFVLRLDLHMGVANSAALKLAGIDDKTPDPVGGVIVRDAKGRATGILRDEARALMAAAIPPRTEAQTDEVLQKVANVAAENGVTQVHVILQDMAELESWRRLRVANKLNVRVYGFHWIQEWEKMAQYVAANGKGDDWVRWGAIKGMVDGSLGSTTAWFYDPYLDAPGSRGLTMSPPETLAAQIEGVDKAGLHLTVHAIGDRANDWALDTFAAVAQKNGPRDRRFRVEHAQHLSPAAIPRFGELGVIPSMQPYHAIDDGRWAERRIGPDRIKGTYAFKSLLDANAPLSFGSDWPVAPFSPILGIDAAVNRQTIDGKNPGGWLPEQRITVEQALKAYTSANAYAGFQEDRLGKIAEGYLADFTVFSADPRQTPAAELKSLSIRRTVVEGRDTFVAPTTAE